MQLLLELLHLSLQGLIGILDLHKLLNIRSPAFETKNSPDITPTSESPILTFSELIKVDKLAGITILVNICILVA